MKSNRRLASFELLTPINPEQVIKRITNASDDLDAKSDSEAWKAFSFPNRPCPGNKPFLHRRSGNSIFLQKRNGPQGNGVDLRVEPVPKGSKLVGRPVLVATDRTWGWFILLLLAYLSYAIISDVAKGAKGRETLLFIPLFFGICLAGYVFLNPSVERRPTEQMAMVENWLESLLNAKCNQGPGTGLTTK